MDWEPFLLDNSIEFVRHGPNVKKGNINISCPFCGDDPSHHMGIKLDGEGWGCWRQSSHRGKSPAFLVQALLSVPFGRARAIVEQYSVADPGDISEALKALEGHAVAVTGKYKGKRLELPEDFVDIKPKGTTKRFFDYLYRRGFGDDTADVIETYELLCAKVGHYQDRIVIPLFYKEKLVTWTGRAITRTTGDTPRYLSHSMEKGALLRPTDFIYDEDSLRKGGKVLFICEGPFDRIKLDYYAREFDCRATCTFTTALSDSQVAAIAGLSGRYSRRILLYDRTAVSAQFEAMDRLGPFGVECGELPEYVEDPGEFQPDDIPDFLSSYLR